MKNKMTLLVILILLIFNFYCLLFIKQTINIFPLINIIFLLLILSFSLLKKESSKFVSELAHQNYKTYLKIPYLIMLLENVMQKTEQAALTLIEKFDVVAVENLNTAGQAKKRLENLLGEDKNSIKNLIKESKKLVESDKMMIEELVSLNTENFNEILKMKELIFKSNSILKNIVEYIQKNKNINIPKEIDQSEKIGENLKGIINEIEDLTHKSNHFITQMREVIASFVEYNQNIMQTRISKVKIMVDKAKLESEQAEKLNEVLLESYQENNEIFQQLSDFSHKVNKSMGKVLESLQFQDITRQQIEHIIHFLDEIKEDMNQKENLYNQLGININKNDINKEIKEQMLKILKVSSEKEIIEEIKYN